MSTMQFVPDLPPDDLHAEIKKAYASVALDPHKGYHFHPGRAALNRMEYILLNS